MKVRLMLSMPRELRDRLKEEASRKGYTLTGFILNILWEYLKS